MGFITGADATSPELTAGGTGVVTAVTGNSITVAKTGNRFVAGKKLKVAKKENNLKNWTFSFWFKKVNTDIINCLDHSRVFTKTKETSPTAKSFFHII